MSNFGYRLWSVKDGDPVIDAVPRNADGLTEEQAGQIVGSHAMHKSRGNTAQAEALAAPFPTIFPGNPEPEITEWEVTDQDGQRWIFKKV